MPNLKINDVDLYYETYGQGEPLVFISGFTADHSLWEGVVGAYTHKYQVIIFDNRGVGNSSDKPDYPYTAQVMADDTIGLLKALELPQAHFVGHSFGSCVTQTIALKYPAFVKSAVLANTLLKAHPRLILFGETRQELMKAGIAASTNAKLNSMLCFSNQFLSPPGRIEQLIKVKSTTMSLKGYQHQLDGLKAFDSRPWVTDIKKPCLLICADEDLLADVADSQFIEKNIKTAEYFCFKNVGHIPMIEHPDIFNQVVLQFLAKY
jgi:3-oxoadipate enol-lactonase